MFISIALLISSLFAELIIIHNINVKTLSTYEHSYVKRIIKENPIDFLNKIDKIENKIENNNFNNLDSLNNILTKTCYFQYSKMNNCLIYEMQGKIRDNNEAKKSDSNYVSLKKNIYCNAFFDYMNLIQPDKKITKDDIKYIIMTSNKDEPLKSVNPDKTILNKYGSLINYLSSISYTKTEINDSLDGSKYTSGNFIQQTKITNNIYEKSYMPTSSLYNLNGLNFYNILKVYSPGKEIYFKNIEVPFFNAYKATNNISDNNRKEFKYAVLSYLNIIVPKLKNINIIINNLSVGNFKGIKILIDNNKYDETNFNYIERKFADSYIKLKNTINLFGYTDFNLFFNKYYLSPNGLVNDILTKGKINFRILRYIINYPSQYIMKSGVKQKNDLSNKSLCDFSNDIKVIYVNYR